MKKILVFSLVSIGFSFLVSCSTSRKVPKKESATQINKKRIPKVNNEKTEDAKLKKDLPYSEIINADLYSFIEKWQGTPHKMGGMTTRGVDCSGLVIQIYREVYGENFVNRRARDLFTETKVVAKSNLREGDLVFFKIRSRSIDHIGLYLANGDFLHVSSRKGVMVSNLNEPYFKKYFFKGGRKKS